MLHRRAAERGHHLHEHGLARIPVVPEHTDLDELVREQREVDLVEYGRCQAVVAHGDHRLEVVCLRAEVTASGGRKGIHGHAVYVLAGPRGFEERQGWHGGASTA